jgi:hypothetical protein
MEAPRPQCVGQLQLWPHDPSCKVCAVDRGALGHSLTELSPPYDSLELLAHLGAVQNDDPTGWWDEWPEPFDQA